MRPFSFAFVLLLFLPLFGEVKGENHPFVASVILPETEARSGPGNDFYPTSMLKQGDQVEVYYEKNGWCAIRPPIGSFSWISARYVDLGTNQIGTVIADGLAARIGSENAPLCETVQVRLKMGEKVLVQDRLETPENAVSPVWFRIAPPSGEFRWIPRCAIDPDAEPVPPARIVRKSNQNSNPLPKREIVQVVYDREPSKPAEKIIPPPQPKVVKPAKRQEKSTAESGGEIAQNDSKVKKLPDSDDSNAELTPLADLLSSSRPDPDLLTKSKTVPADPFQRAFDELKDETRLVMTRPTEDWVFETLLKRGNELYEIAPTEKDLEKVYHLVETLQRTRAVRQEIGIRRQFKTSGLLPPPSQSGPLQSGNSPIVPAAPFHSNSGAPAPVRPQPLSQSVLSVPNSITPASVQITSLRDNGYDLVGKLGEFAPLPKGHPPFALADENGQVICLVSPAQGCDLKPYVGNKVGINGVLGLYQRPGRPDNRHVLVNTIEIVE